MNSHFQSSDTTSISSGLMLEDSGRAGSSACDPNQAMPPWSIPALVVFFLGGIAWISSHVLDPARPLPSAPSRSRSRSSRSTGSGCSFTREQGVASVNRLVAPAGVPLHLQITSASVFNVFFVPRLGSEIYSMYGMTSQLNLQADRARHLSSACRRTSAVTASPTWRSSCTPSRPSEFAAGPLQRARCRARCWMRPPIASCCTQSQNVKPYTYRAVQRGLFDDIVSQRLPPGEGPPGADRRRTARQEN